MVKNKISIKTSTVMLTFAALLMVCVAFFWKSEASSPVCSTHDDAVLMSGDVDEITQTWEADKKNITGITLYSDCDNCTDLIGTMTVSISYDDKVLSTGSVDLKDFSSSDQINIPMDNVNLELGNRYVIDFKLDGISDGTKLSLQSNADYSGLTRLSDGNEVEDVSGEDSGALAVDIKYARSSNIAWMLKLIVVFGAFAALFSIIFNRSAAETIAMSTAAIFIILYLFGIFGALLVGVRAVIVLSAVIFICIPYLMNIRNRSLSSIISPGVIAYIVLLAIYFVLDRNAVAGKVDDLNQWQTCVRDMWYSGSYPFHAGSFVEFKRYTPGMGTLEYFITYLYGDYREGIVLFACHSIGFAFMSVFYSGITWKGWHKTIPATAVIAAVPILIYQSHYGIMYVDSYLGMVGAYLFIIYFSENKQSIYKVLSIVLGAIFLSMIKEIGLVIAGIMFLVILIDLWYHDSKRKWKSLIGNKYTGRFFAGALITIAIFVSWEIYCSVNGEGNAFSTVFKSVVPQSWLTSINNFISNFQVTVLAAEANVVNNNGILQYANGKAVVTPVIVLRSLGAFIIKDHEFLGLSFAGIIVLLSAVCLLLRLGGLFKRLNLRIRAVLAYTLLGSILYSLFMAVCYIFLFSEDSPIPAARRYIGTYVLVYIIAIVGVIFVSGNYVESINSWKQQIAWLLGACVVLEVPAGHPYRTGEDVMGNYYTIWQNHQSIGEVFRSFAQKDEKVYYVAYKDSDMVPQYDYLIFYNAVAPNLTQGLGAGWKPVEEIPDDYGMYYVKLSCDEWAQLLADNYSYVYLQNVDDYFCEHYGDLFEDKSEICDGGTYKVQTDNEANTKLIKIAYENLD